VAVSISVVKAMSALFAASRPVASRRVDAGDSQRDGVGLRTVTMAHALFFGLPLHGHTNPSLGLVRALVDRGDRVTCYSTEVFAEAITRAGGHFRPYRNQFLRELTSLPEHMEDLAALMMRTTADVLETELPEAKAALPDYVIADSVAPWGQWIGQTLAVPIVTSITTFAVNRQVMAYAVHEGNRPKSLRRLAAKIRSIASAYVVGRSLRRKYGVAGTGVMGLLFGQSGLNIVYTSSAFQPRAETFDGRFVFIGPPALAQTAMAGDPATVPVRPRIYVSLGTLFNADVSFFRKCFSTFAGRDVDVVMSVGHNVSLDALGAVPANVDVRPFVDQLDVLRGASLFVTHGGMNSVSESVCCGVPMVVIPQMSEQRLVGRRVAELGAGVMLADGRFTESDLWNAVEGVMNNPRCRAGAVAIRQSFVDAGGVARGVQAIHAYTRQPA
jgi:MGT family glycosyltransferase